MWQQTVLGWLLNNMNHPVLPIRYEDLLMDTERELGKILNFVQVPYSRQQLHSVVQSGYSEYHRPHGVEFEHYTASQKNYVRAIVQSTSNLLRNLNINITGYLEP